MKDLLLLVRDDVGQPARLHAAVKLAQTFAGRVTCLEVDETPAMGDEVDAATVDGRVLQDLVHTRAGANRERVERILRSREVDFVWTKGEGKVAERLSEQAAFHDLTIVNTQPRTYSWRDGSFVVSDLVRATHQPVLLVPDEDGSLDFDRRAVIAWDGSPPCIAAMRAALPLLKRTKLVTMIEVGEHGDGPTVERGAEYLRRQGVSPRLERGGGRRPADWLLGRCGPEHTSYCVMGAFGRSRGTEAVFGGTTLDMLDAARVPLFVAH